MQRSKRTTVLLALAVVGCADSLPTSPAVPAPAPALARASAGPSASTARPISGRCTTTFAAIPRPLPAIYRQVATGTCELSHLGRTRLRLVQDVNFAAGTQQSVEVTYTAANGDVLRASNVGSSVRSGLGVAFTATVTFVGGTGRFAHATGQAHATGTADFVANTSAYTLEGWIAYGAADRRD
jgi:hypothetical protein